MSLKIYMKAFIDIQINLFIYLIVYMHIQPYTKNLNNIIAKNKVIDSIVVKQLLYIVVIDNKLIEFYDKLKNEDATIILSLNESINNNLLKN